MTNARHLMDELHDLAEQIRHHRALPARSQLKDKAELAAMEARMVSLWTSIRAARAGGAELPAHQPAPRTTRPKWG